MKAAGKKLAIAMGFLWSSCLPSHQSLISASAPTDTPELFIALDEHPASSTAPDAYLIYAASPSGLTVDSVRFCVGDLDACRQGTFSAVSARAVQSGMVVSTQALTLADQLVIHVFAKNAQGQDLEQSYKVVSHTSVQPSDGDANQNPPPTGSNQQGPQCYGAPSDLVCQVEIHVWRLTNEKRATRNREPFAFAPRMGCASRLWSVEQARRSNISHDWFSNGNLDDKYRRDCQGTGDIYAENVAMSGWGGSDAQSVAQEFVDMWWNSPGHQANMLGDYKSMGVGFAQSGSAWYGTQNMGSE